MTIDGLNIVQLTLAFLGGIALAGLHQWSLWWTVAQLRQRERAGLWLLASFALRMILLLAILAAIGMTGAGNLLSFGIGLIVARLVITGWLVLKSPPRQPKSAP